MRLLESFNRERDMTARSSDTNAHFSARGESLRIMLAAAEIDSSTLSYDYEIQLRFPSNDTKAQYFGKQLSQPTKRGTETSEKTRFITTIGAGLVSASNDDFSVRFEFVDTSFVATYTYGSDTPPSPALPLSTDLGSSGSNSKRNKKGFFDRFSTLQLVFITIVTVVVSIACCLVCCQWFFYKDIIDRLFSLASNGGGGGSRGSSGVARAPAATRRSKKKPVNEAVDQYDTMGLIDDREYYYTDGKYAYEDDGKFYQENGVVYRDIESDEEFETLQT